MFFVLIATFAAGFGVAGLVLLLNRMTGGRLPKWLMPVAAGLAMILYTIWDEYNWMDRTVAGLPEGLEVVANNEDKAFYRPWTYVAPFSSSFIAVDTLNIRSNPEVPEQVMTEVLVMGRWSGASLFPILLDCSGGRSAALADGVEFDERGAVKDPEWRTVGAEDPVLRTACKEA